MLFATSLKAQNKNRSDKQRKTGLITTDAKSINFKLNN
jgi:hypothetical protein